MGYTETFGFEPLKCGPIFDSHAHYDDPRYDGDRDFLLSSLCEYGVTNVLLCSSDLESSEKNVKLAEQYDFLYAAVGVHPHEAGASGVPDDFPEEIFNNHKVVAVGETGLDYHYDLSDRIVQKLWFDHCLSLSAKHRLPAVIHSREATADVIDILRAHRPAGVVHCFSGSVETAAIMLDMGLYIGLGGTVTFKNAQKAVAAAKYVPLDRMLLETDAPYMTPAPYRGKRCHSGHIRFTAEAIAALRGMDVDELYNVTRNNAERLFLSR